MFERASRAVKTVLGDAAAEAGRRGDRRIGTDHLLLALLHDAEIADLVGATLAEARAAADHLDREALVALGFPVDGLPSVHSTLGTGSGHAPLSSGVRATLERAFALATDRSERLVEAEHVLDALRERRPPDPGAVLLQAICGRSPS